MTKAEYLEKKEKARLNRIARNRQQAKAEKMFEQIKLAIVEHVDTISIYSETCSISSVEQLIAVRKAMREMPFEVEVVTSSVQYVGKPSTWESHIPESVREYEDCIYVTYRLKFKYTYKKQDYSNYVYLNFYMHENELPAEFTKDGCGFKDTVRTDTRTTREFVCENRGF